MLENVVELYQFRSFEIPKDSFEMNMLT